MFALDNHERQIPQALIRRRASLPMARFFVSQRVRFQLYNDNNEEKAPVTSPRTFFKYCWSCHWCSLFNRYYLWITTPVSFFNSSVHRSVNIQILQQPNNLSSVILLFVSYCTLDFDQWVHIFHKNISFKLHDKDRVTGMRGPSYNLSLRTYMYMLCLR